MHRLDARREFGILAGLSDTVADVSCCRSGWLGLASSEDAAVVCFDSGWLGTFTFLVRSRRQRCSLCLTVQA